MADLQDDPSDTDSTAAVGDIDAPPEPPAPAATAATGAAPASSAERARELLAAYPVFDGHNSLAPTLLRRLWCQPPARSRRGRDLPRHRHAADQGGRARRAVLGAPCGRRRGPRGPGRQHDAGADRPRTGPDRLQPGQPAPRARRGGAGRRPQLRTRRLTPRTRLGSGLGRLARHAPRVPLPRCARTRARGRALGRRRTDPLRSGGRTRDEPPGCRHRPVRRVRRDDARHLRRHQGPGDVLPLRRPGRHRRPRRRATSPTRS